jgi:flagellar biosynthesis/type III secretory pathway protein FliH
VVIILIPTWLRLYQTPASEALALDCPSAWALVPLMLHSEEELDEAGLRLAKTRNENAIVQFLLFAARKYDRNELRRRYGMFEQATVEIAKTTEFGQEIMQAGRREGLEEGMEKGRQVMLDAIRAVLRRKFPTLAEHPAIQMVSLDRANSVLDQIFQADTESAALAAITGGN